MGCACSKPDGAAQPIAVMADGSGVATTLLSSPSSTAGKRAIISDGPAFIKSFTVESLVDDGDPKEVVRRIAERKSTPFLRPGDLSQVKFAQGDDHPACEDSESDDDGPPMATKRSADRKGTPFTRAGEIDPFLKPQFDEALDAVSDYGSPLGDAKRSVGRKATPFVKRGDFEDDDDDEPRLQFASPEALSDCGSPLMDAKRIAGRLATPFVRKCDVEADPDERRPQFASPTSGSDCGSPLMDAMRSRGRKGTPWVKKGDMEPDPDDLRPQFAEVDSESDCGDVDGPTLQFQLPEDDVSTEATTRHSSRKATPWVSQGAAQVLQFDVDESDAEEQEEGSALKVQRVSGRKATPWVRPSDAQEGVEPAAPAESWLFGSCCQPGHMDSSSEYMPDGDVGGDGL